MKAFKLIFSLCPGSGQEGLKGYHLVKKIKNSEKKIKWKTSFFVNSFCAELLNIKPLREVPESRCILK